MTATMIEDGIEAQALEKVRRTYAIVEGPLLPLGAAPDVSLRRCELIPRAIIARVASTKKHTYMGAMIPDGSARDGELLGGLIHGGMRSAIEAHGRAEVSQAFGEWRILTGRTNASSNQYDERLQRVVGELSSVEARLKWAYAGLPDFVAAHWPTPPGEVSGRLHARRKELLSMLDGAFASTRLTAGHLAVNGILAQVAPGPSLADSAVAGWVMLADAVRTGGAFPSGFAEAWSSVVPDACSKYEGWGELAPFVMKIA